MDPPRPLEMRNESRSPTIAVDTVIGIKKEIEEGGGLTVLLECSSVWIDEITRIERKERGIHEGVNVMAGGAVTNRKGKGGEREIMVLAFLTED